MEILGKIRREKTIKKKSMRNKIILNLEKKDYDKLEGMIEDLKDVTNAVEIKIKEFKIEFI